MHKSRIFIVINNKNILFGKLSKCNRIIHAYYLFDRLNQFSISDRKLKLI